MYCHSQFTRPGDVTPSRPSEAGQFAYDQPHQLGTLRTGPDLAEHRPEARRPVGARPPQGPALADAELDHAELQLPLRRPAHRNRGLPQPPRKPPQRLHGPHDSGQVPRSRLPGEQVRAHERELREGPRHLRGEVPHLPRLRRRRQRPVRDDQQRAAGEPARREVQEPAGQLRLLAHQRGRSRHGHARVGAVAERGRPLARHRSSSRRRSWT